MHQELLERIQQNKTPTKGSQQSNMDRSDSDDNNEGESKDKEEKEVIDDSSTHTEHLSGSKNKKGLIMSVDGDEDSKSSEDDNRHNNGDVVGQLYSVQYKSIFGAPGKVRRNMCDEARPLSQV